MPCQAGQATDQGDPCELRKWQDIRKMARHREGSPNRLSNLTIVVVEDHDDARTYLGVFLGHLGANVIMARDAFEGLEAIKKPPEFGFGRHRYAGHERLRIVA